MPVTRGSAVVARSASHRRGSGSSSGLWGWVEIGSRNRPEAKALAVWSGCGAVASAAVFFGSMRASGRDVRGAAAACGDGALVPGRVGELGRRSASPGDADTDGRVVFSTRLPASTLPTRIADRARRVTSSRARLLDCTPG